MNRKGVEAGDAERRGAFLPPLMGLIADAVHSTEAGFVVPLAAILFITWTAIVNLRGAHRQPSVAP